MSVRNAFEVRLPHGPLVVLAELTCHELLLAMRSAGTERAAMARGFSVSREAIRYSIRQVDGKDVSVHDLAGSLWAKYFPRTRHTFQLTQAWSQIHTPDPDLVDACINGASIEDDGQAECWSVKLPDGRRVVMVEGDPDTVEDVMRQASAGSRSETAQEFATLIEGCRRAIRSVDDRALQATELDGRGWDALFSVRDTFLLGRVWQHMHVGGDEVAVGELRPVPGA